MKAILAAFSILVSSLIGFASGASAQTPPTLTPELEAVHKELRALKQRAVDAVNKKDGEALFKELSPNIIFTAMNNDNVRGMQQMREYYARMMVGAERMVRNMSISADADDLSVLYANNTMAVVSGTSNAHFDIKTGLNYDIALRWTATLEKSSGAWKFAAAHFSADAINNPLISLATAFWKWMAVGLAVVGLAIGYLLGSRRGKPA
jgi:ketosteroid isomerase-like protein